VLVLAAGHGSDRWERIVLRECVMVGARATLRELAGLGLALLGWAWSPLLLLFYYSGLLFCFYFHQNKRKKSGESF
jgi:hypothetical protein